MKKTNKTNLNKNYRKEVKGAFIKKNDGYIAQKETRYKIDVCGENIFFRTYGMVNCEVDREVLDMYANNLNLFVLCIFRCEFGFDIDYDKMHIELGFCESFCKEQVELLRECIPYVVSCNEFEIMKLLGIRSNGDDEFNKIIENTPMPIFENGEIEYE